MCGICGFNWEDRKTLKEMTDIMRYRGPDQYDYYADPLISLGHRRLNIIDLSEKGRQPMCNEDGTIWIVYNGEIYNFAEIKYDLEKKGHRFKSGTDTEVIIHAYEEYGITSVNLFNGMFAFAIWDSRNKKIILVRDRLGVKPLFYYFDKIKNKFIFASEIKSLLQNSEIKKEMNFEVLNQLMIYAHSINNETLLKDICEVPPGHALIYDFKELRIEKYWGLEVRVENGSENYFVDKLRNILKQSVEKRMVADVPIGASLSGGLDSSSVVAFMSRFTENPVKTFTVGFNDESDELKEAKIVSDFFGTDHHEIIVDFNDVTKNLAKVLWHAEMPFEKPAMYATYFLSKGISKNNVTIDLSGEGSDEIFAGYNRSGIFLKNNIPDAEKINCMISGHFSNAEDKKIFFSGEVLSHEKNSLIPEKIILSEIENVPFDEHLNSSLHFEIKKQLPGIHLLRLDRMSMASSHEIRTPFVDYELMEFGMTVPSALKWKENRKKYILQKTMEGILPEEIVRRVKLPFHMPLEKYFRNNFVEISESIISNSSIPKIIKKENILNIIRKIKSGELSDDKTLRQILFATNLELFNRIFIEKDKIRESDFNINNYS
ncbi:asparagine synthase (glutamine-hydrolyzing) [Candidatus Pacearchaeota archaeon]|nr:asparagine synthase (glutamine-hydrolyzing) [Candidatus Pacearchaeota archaeon]